MLASSVVQVAVEVRAKVLPAVQVPVAMKGLVVPRANDGLAGATANETRVACPTFKVAEAAMEPNVAVMVALPTPAAVANPVLAMVAIAGEDELQFTALVRSCALLSL